MVLEVVYGGSSTQVYYTPLLASADVYPLGRGTSEEEVSC